VIVVVVVDEFVVEFVHDDDHETREDGCVRVGWRASGPLRYRSDVERTQ